MDCKYCKGTGEIFLFSSRVKCDCRMTTTEIPPSYEGFPNILAVKWVSPLTGCSATTEQLQHALTKVDPETHSALKACFLDLCVNLDWGEHCWALALDKKLLGVLQDAINQG